MLRIGALIGIRDRKLVEQYDEQEDEQRPKVRRTA
jgi:hypothetical protein